MKIKRSNTDKWFSEAIRASYDYVCQNCGKISPPPFDNGQMDCAHNFSRRTRLTRWDPRNAVCLCRGCHMSMTDSPDEHVTFMKAIFLLDYDLMRAKGNSLKKVTKKDELDIIKHYKEEVKRIKELRMDGDINPVELKLPEVLK